MMKALISCVACMAALTACADMQPAASVAETIERAPNLTIVSKIMKDTGMDQTLRGPGPFTVFAPTDEAFKALPAAVLQQIAQDKNMARSVISYHVVTINLETTTAPNGAQKTMSGDDISVYKAGTTLTVENAVVTQADVKASNGVVEVIDTVLLPPKH
jgi:uncharacterized surface protein with fasciclin (FAS1) repeats